MGQNAQSGYYASSTVLCLKVVDLKGFYHKENNFITMYGDGC